MADQFRGSSYWTKRRKIKARVAQHMAEIERVIRARNRTRNSFPTPDIFLPSNSHHSCLDTVFCESAQDDSKAEANPAQPVQKNFISLYDDSSSNSKAEANPAQPVQKNFISLYDDSSSDQASSDLENDDRPDLFKNLAGWATQYKISHNALSALLGVLHPHHTYLPKDARTLLGTAKVTGVKNVAGGLYYHFGIRSHLLKMLTQEFPYNCISLQINIDGLPIFKSSTGQFWPILGMLDQFKKKDPFVIGLWYGERKPMCASSYLEEFVEECSQLQNEGLTINEKIYTFKISAVICDAPARAFVKNVIGHNGYYGCDKCKQRGEWHGKIAYTKTDSELRTNTDFVVHYAEEIQGDSDDENEDKHIKRGASPFQGMDIGMISQFPIDYMHQCCLGVTRKVLRMLTKQGPLKFRLGPRITQSLSRQLVSLQGHVPCEFARKPRSLQELDRWKATEFRFFLLYAGPVVLKTHVPDEIYKNFMLFSCAMHILLSPEMCSTHIDFAETLLQSFVTHFGKLYGQDQMVYNVHVSIHLVNDARSFGALDGISCFPFENYSILRKIKKDGTKTLTTPTAGDLQVNRKRQ